MKSIIFFVFIIFVVNIYAQNNQSILIKNATIHVGNGTLIEKGNVVIENKIITYVGTEVIQDEKKHQLVIDATNQHLYPGFVATNSTLGLVETESVRATVDFNEIGGFIPHVRSQIAFNTESKIIPTVKLNGVTTVQVTPRGNYISGTSSIMKLDGWNWEDATLNSGDGIHLNWPKYYFNSKRKTIDNYEKEVQLIEDFFINSKNYCYATDSKLDIRLEAMKPIFKGNARVYFHCNNLKEINDVLDFIERQNIKYPVLVGAYDVIKVAERVRKMNIPVMLPRVHSLPERVSDDINYYYSLPSRLYENGIKFCIQNQGDMEAMNTRNLPFLAGSAVAYGLPKEEAIKAITLNACEITGVSDRLGSIELGKNATLFLSRGDALDVITNLLTLLVIDGKIQSLQNHQIDLKDKFENKYKQQH